MVVLSLAVVYFIIFRKYAHCNITSVMDYFISYYGAGYGTEWIYFPDGDGTPHFVSLIDDNEADMRGGYNEVEFRLYTRTKNNTQDSILMSESAEPAIKIDEIDLSKSRIKIVTHGWRSSVESDAVASIKNAYLQTQDVNVVTVDWSYTADSLFYHWVANQTMRIGIDVATFLNGLSDRYNVTGDQIHLIGHSLGAHIMGIAADQSNLTIDRITGLDPARPLFEYPSRDKTQKLDAFDAKFVDVIHTCGGVLGIEGDIGTADFFPNSGIPPQPGCETIPKILEACSHGRSFYYFAESIITPRAFPAYQCSNWLDYLENRCEQYGYMGENSIHTMNRKRNVNYIKPEDPEFLKVLKRQAGYDDRNHKFDELENDEKDFVDDEDSEKPQVVVLKKGDLTAEEAEVEEQRLQQKEEQTKADLTQRVIFKPKNASGSAADEKKRKHKENDSKSSKEKKRKPVLSFDDDEEDEDS